MHVRPLATFKIKVVQCIADELRDKVESREKTSGFYVIRRDETTDESSTEQLSVCLKYYDNESKQIWEDFVAFLDVMDKKYAAEDIQTEEADEGIQAQEATYEEAIPKTMNEFLK